SDERWRNLLQPATVWLVARHTQVLIDGAAGVDPRLLRGRQRRRDRGRARLAGPFDTREQRARAGRQVAGARARQRRERRRLAGELECGERTTATATSFRHRAWPFQQRITGAG